MGSGVGFMVLLVVLVVAIVKAKKGLIAGTAVGLLLTLVAGVWSASHIATQSRKRVANFMAPRSGGEIYAALFGEPVSGCVQVLNRQDQEMPMVDFAIYLEAQTCPQEMARIAKQRTYEIRKEVNITYTGSIDHVSWFTPATLDDSIWVWTQLDEFGNGQEIYLSEDSTHFYCRDIAN